MRRCTEVAGAGREGEGEATGLDVGINTKISANIISLPLAASSRDSKYVVEH